MKNIITTRFIRNLSPLLCALSLTAALSTPAQAQISAGFNDGNTSTQIDGWTGLAGNGWVNSWQTNTTADATLTATVTDTNPLAPGEGNYLAVTSTNTRNENHRRTMIRRQYQSNGDVSMVQPQTVSFLFRIDAGLDNISGINIFDTDSTGSSTANASSAWSIRDVATGNYRQWRFTNAGNVAVNSGVRLYENDTYSFLLNLDPISSTWTGTITNLDFTANGRAGSATFTTDILNFYGSATAGTIGGYLHWAVNMAAGSTETPSIANWSLDSISVAPAIPEASTYALLSATAALLLVIGLRKRQMR